MVKQTTRKLVSLSVKKLMVVNGSTGTRKRSAFSRHERVQRSVWRKGELLGQENVQASKLHGVPKVVKLSLAQALALASLGQANLIRRIACSPPWILKDFEKK